MISKHIDRKQVALKDNFDCNYDFFKAIMIIKKINANCKIVILIFLLSCVGLSKIYSQSHTYEIYQAKGQYILRNRIDFKIVFKSTSADETIQYSLDKMRKDQKGGELYIYSGEYLLRKQLNVPSKVSITGIGSATVLRIIKGHNTGTAFYCKDESSITISNLGIKSRDSAGRVGICIDHSGNCTISDVLIVGMRDNGIVLCNHSFLCEVRGCKIADVKGSGILLKDLNKGGRGGDFVPNLVTNCIVYASGVGIECNHALVANIVACEVYQADSYGFYIHNISNSVLVSGCRTFQISGEAIRVDGSHEINISSNIFCWHTGHGIVLNNVRWGTVTGNNVIDNGSINLYDRKKYPFIKEGKRPMGEIHNNPDSLPRYNGICLTSGTAGITVSANAIFNWAVAPPMEFGILEDPTCFSNIITSNNINYFKNKAVFSQGKETELANNIGKEIPYMGKLRGNMQFFDTRLIEEFIKEMNK